MEKGKLIPIEKLTNFQSKSHRAKRRVYKLRKQNLSQEPKTGITPHKELFKPIEIQRLSSQSPTGEEEICLDDFEIIEEIGSGTYGTVYKAKFISVTKFLEGSSNSFYAIKKISLEHKPKEMVREFFLLKNIHHDNIIK